MVTLAAILMVISVVAFMQTLFSPLPFYALESIIAGIFCGFGTTVISIMWADYFARYDLRNSILVLGILVGLGIILNIILSILPATIQLIAFILLVAIGVTTPLFHSKRTRTHKADHTQSDACNEAFSHTHDEASELSEATGESRLGDVKRMLSVILWPFLGFLLFALTMAARKILIFDLISAESLCSLVSIIIIIPLCFLRSEKPLLPLVYQVFLPIIVSILIVVFSFPEHSLMREIGAMCLYVFFGIIGLLALSSFTAAAAAKEFSVPLIFGFIIAAFSAVSLLGLVMRDASPFTENFDALLMVLTTIYFIFLVLSPGIRAWREMFTPTEASSTHSIQGDLESRCLKLSKRYGLSPRESEVMTYIGRGYSPAYIAKKLFLSDSTVRSHVKSIYRKLDVHSRTDILQLIDSDG